MKKNHIKSITSGILAISLAATLWFNRQSILLDIFYDGSAGHSRTCPPGGIPPTEWPAALNN